MIYESLADWKKEGERRFGKDESEWAFVCPACGNIAKVKDFERFKSKGASPDSAAETCIGRWTGGRNGPYKCDWAAFGLFRGPWIVKIDNKEIPVFDFAETDGAGN